MALASFQAAEEGQQLLKFTEERLLKSVLFQLGVLHKSFRAEARLAALQPSFTTLKTAQISKCLLHQWTLLKFQ